MKAQNSAASFRAVFPLSALRAVALCATICVVAAVCFFKSQTSAAAFAPAINITAPASGATFTAPANVTIAAEPNAEVGAIDYVAFLVNNAEVGRDSTAPYSINYTFQVGGTYTLTAIAADSGGNIISSGNSVTVTVNSAANQPPTVSLDSPANIGIYEFGQTIRFAATAADADGSIARVEFYNGSTKIGEDATAPYEFVWTNAAVAPNYTVRARAVDNAGAATDSAVARISVLPQGAFNPVATPDNSPLPTSGTVIYVSDADGSDSNPGTLAAPVKSLRQAVILATQPGATIVLRAGVYRGTNNSRTFPRQVFIRSYPNEQVILKGSQVYTNWQFDAALGLYYIDFPFQITAPPTARDSNVDYTANPFAGLGEQVFVNGRPLAQVARVLPNDTNFVPQDCTGGVVKSGTFCLDYGANRASAADNRLYIKDDPTGQTVEATIVGSGMFLPQDANGDATGSSVRGIGFMHYGDRGLVANAPQVTIENNTFAFCNIRGFTVNRPDTSANNVWVNPNAERSNAVVRGNTTNYNGRQGFFSQRSNGSLFENNTATFNNLERFRQEFDAAGAKIIKADGQTFRGNKVENNIANGLWLDVSITNAVVTDNRAAFNAGIGIFFEVSSRAIIAFNLAHNNSVGMRVSGSSSVKLYNNTLARNGRALWIFDSNRVNKTPDNTNQEIVNAEIAAGIDWETRNITARNNIFSEARDVFPGSSISFSGVLDTEDGACGSVGAPCNDTENIVGAPGNLNYDLYYRPSASQPTRLVRWRPVGSGVDTGYTSLAAFQSATGHESNGLELSGDAPLFRQPATNDFRLRPNSAAVNSGEPLPADVAAATNRPAGVPLNRGALDVAPPTAVMLSPEFSFASGDVVTTIYGAPNLTVAGRLADNGQAPQGQISINLDAASQIAQLDENGDFSVVFDTAGLTPRAAPYDLSFAYLGNFASNPSFAAQQVFVTYAVKTRVLPKTFVRPPLKGKGQTLIQLVKADGTNVSAPEIALTARSVNRLPNGARVRVDLANLLRYDARFGGYLLDASTAGLTRGAYRLTFTAANDALPHTIEFEIY